MLMVSVKSPKKKKCKKPKGRRLENQSIAQVNGLQATFRKKKGRSNNNEKKAIERQQSVIPGLKSQMFRIQLHKRGHSVQKKGYLIHTAFSQRGQS